MSTLLVIFSLATVEVQGILLIFFVMNTRLCKLGQIKLTFGRTFRKIGKIRTVVQNERVRTIQLFETLARGFKQVCSAFRFY